MNTDGSNQHRVSDNLNDYGAASWSPDSSSIVFSSYRDHTRDIYSLDLSSGNYSRLTSDPLSGDAPAWGPCIG
jgi:Tol biopolymer transport system component